MLNRIEYETLLTQLSRLLGRLRSDAQAIEAEGFRNAKIRQADTLIELMDQMDAHAVEQAARIEALEREVRHLRAEARPAHQRIFDRSHYRPSSEKVRAESLQQATRDFPELYYGSGDIPLSLGDFMELLATRV